MKRAPAALQTGTVIVAAGYVSSAAASQQSKATGTKGAATPAVVPPPVAVEVIAVDPKAKTILTDCVRVIKRDADAPAVRGGPDQQRDRAKVVTSQGVEVQ